MKLKLFKLGAEKKLKKPIKFPFLAEGIITGAIIWFEDYLGEVIKVTESYIEVMYGGEALHYCIEKYDINDKRITVLKEVDNYES